MRTAEGMSLAPDIDFRRRPTRKSRQELSGSHTLRPPMVRKNVKESGTTKLYYRRKDEI